MAVTYAPPIPKTTPPPVKAPVPHRPRLASLAGPRIALRAADRRLTVLPDQYRS